MDAIVGNPWFYWTVNVLFVCMILYPVIASLFGYRPYTGDNSWWPLYRRAEYVPSGSSFASKMRALSHTRLRNRDVLRLIRVQANKGEFQLKLPLNRIEAPLNDLGLYLFKKEFNVSMDEDDRNITISWLEKPTIRIYEDLYKKPMSKDKGCKKTKDRVQEEDDELRAKVRMKIKLRK